MDLESQPIIFLIQQNIIEQKLDWDFVTKPPQMERWD